VNYLTKNSKIKKSATSRHEVYNFGIPAFLSTSGTKTCPNAKACVSGCYARSGFYQMSHVAQAYEKRLQATKKGKQLVVRIHDSGDFYSPAYLAKWRMVVEACTSVHFYAYTKMVGLFALAEKQPSNFNVIFLLGGKEDHMINQETDTFSKVYESKKAMRGLGAYDASQDDLVAAYGHGHIGLVYHGNKPYQNTTWGNV